MTTEKNKTLDKAIEAIRGIVEEDFHSDVLRYNNPLGLATPFSRTTKRSPGIIKLEAIRILKALKDPPPKRRLIFYGSLCEKCTNPSMGSIVWEDDQEPNCMDCGAKYPASELGGCTATLEFYTPK